MVDLRLATLQVEGAGVGIGIGGIFVQVIEKYADALTRKISASVDLPIELEPWTIYGIVLIALMYFMPAGIAGGLSNLWTTLTKRGTTGRQDG